jgi:hypothetical protein
MHSYILLFIDKQNSLCYNCHVITAIKEQEMKKSTKARLLSAGLAVATAFGPAAAITSCDNGTTSQKDDARDVTIVEDVTEGYKVVVNCKPSQDAAKNNIKTAIDAIITDNDWEKNYIVRPLPKITTTHNFGIMV